MFPIGCYKKKAVPRNPGKPRKPRKEERQEESMQKEENEMVNNLRDVNKIFVKLFSSHIFKMFLDKKR